MDRFPLHSITNYLLCETDKETYIGTCIFEVLCKKETLTGPVLLGLAQVGPITWA